MNGSFYDYESYGMLDFNRHEPELLEAYAGTSIVTWSGRIERQLDGFLADAEKGRNWPYADKIREFLRIWRDNEITGSLNRETLDILKSAADVLAVDAWNLKNYFSSLRDQIRKLIASEEELPRDLDMNANNPARGGGGGMGRGAPPLNPDFGPQDSGPGLGGGQVGGGADMNPPGTEGQTSAEGAEGGLQEPPGAEGGPGPEGPEGGPEDDEEDIRI